MGVVDLNRVGIFVRVVEDGGFTAAARSLGLPKSSVSRAVALLERELDVRLLMRSTRAVTLTEAGEAFYARASRGIAAIAEGAELVVDLDASLTGRIRVTAPVDAGSWLLAPIVAEFTLAHPGVHIDVVLTSRIVDLVEERFDLALRAGRLRDQSLIARKLANVEFGLYGAPRYLETHGAPESPADLAQHRFVTFRDPRPRVRLVCQNGDTPIEAELSGSIVADDLSFMFHATIAGAGLALLPSFMAASQPESVTRVLADWCVPGDEFQLVYPSARYVPRRVAAFRDAVLERLSRSSS